MIPCQYTLRANQSNVIKHKCIKQSLPTDCNVIVPWQRNKQSTIYKLNSLVNIILSFSLRDNSLHLHECSPFWIGIFVISKMKTTGVKLENLKTMLGARARRPKEAH